MATRRPHDDTGKYENDPQMRAVALGIAVNHFVEHSKTGQFIVQRAHEARESAIIELLGTSPDNIPEITRLQWEAKVPEMVLEWLTEAIDLGISAEVSIATEEAGN